jgi:hypothetical protein
MKIKNARPARGEPTAAGFRTIARFCLEPCEGVLLFDCTLVVAPNGKLLVYGPRSHAGTNVLSLSPVARREVIEMMRREAGLNHEESCRAA